MNSKLELNRTFGSAYYGKRVLVTGHTGFKGAWLVEWLLALGAEVTGYSLPPPTNPSLFDQLGHANRIRHIEGDVRDLAHISRVVAEVRPHFLFHLAAQPLVRLSYEQPVETYATNVMGTVNVLEALRQYQSQSSSFLSSSSSCSNSSSGSEGGVSSENLPLELSTRTKAVAAAGSLLELSTRTIDSCAAVFITTDKCYDNREWVHSYREEDPMGGHDPYSSSKGAAELVISAYRKSYFSADFHTRTESSNSNFRVLVASARAGNVIGGGDWAIDRIVPDCIRSLQKGEAIPVRNKVATRPWQHVLEPLSGYLWLGAAMRGAAGGILPFDAGAYADAYNFGPTLNSNRTVLELVKEVLRNWSGEWIDRSDPNALHEAKLLSLSIDKAHHLLHWGPVWCFDETIRHTVAWYREAVEGAPTLVDFTQGQIRQYCLCATQQKLAWIGSRHNR